MTTQIIFRENGHQDHCLVVTGDGVIHREGTYHECAAHCIATDEAWFYAHPSSYQYDHINRKAILFQPDTDPPTTLIPLNDLIRWYHDENRKGFDSPLDEEEGYEPPEPDEGREPS